MARKKKEINFEDVTLRQEITSRGGGIEIDLTAFGFKGAKMTAYQNYLGGGLLGRVCSSNNTEGLSEEKRLELGVITENLKKYFHGLTNPEGGFEALSYERNQKMPVSAY